ncbi:MAG: aminopeptidase, partial [Coriobacteriales bacterium]
MNKTLDENLRTYARLVIRSGCNLARGQELFLVSDIANAQFVRALVREAYDNGASKVTVRWGDEVVGRMNYDYRSLESFSEFPDWQALLQNGMARRGAALLFVSSEDPEAFSGVDQRKLVAYTRAAHEACKEWRDGMDFGHNVWCIVGASSPGWARRVFPDLPEDEAVSKLWDAIFTTVRVDTPDPIAAWEAHRRSFDRRRAFLNEHRFDSLHYENSLGTDFTVGLTPKSRWEGGGSQ